MDSNKIFSVVIPVKNGSATIENALTSLVNSTRFIKEVIVVLDHCTDNTEEIVLSFQDRLPIITLYNTGVAGPGNSRQIGLDYSTGEWVCFLDADDTFASQAFYNIKRVIDRYIDETYPLIVGSFNFVVEDNQIYRYDGVLVWMHGKFYRNNFLKENNIRFKPNLYTAEDAYFNEVLKFKMQELDQCVYLYNNVVYNWNYNNSSMTHQGDYLFDTYADYLVSYYEPLQHYLDKMFESKSEEEYIQLLESRYINIMGVIIYSYFCDQNDYNINPRVRQTMISKYLQNFHKINKQKLFQKAIIDDNFQEFNKIRQDTLASIGNFLEHESFYDWYEKLDF